MDQYGNTNSFKAGLIIVGVFVIAIILLIVLVRPTDEGMYEQLKSGNTEQRTDAVVYFVRSGDDFAITALIEALDDQEEAIRIAAVEALGNLKNEKAIEPLADVLANDKSDSVREAALTALANIGTKSCADLLVPFIEKGPTEMRIKTIASLAKIGDESHAAAIVNQLKSAIREVYNAAADALISMGSTAMKPLVAELNNPESRCKKLVYIFCNIDDPQASSVLDARCDGDPQFVADNYTEFILRGRAGDEVMLIEALMTCGDVTMAENYLNCGNEQLEDAAEEWADQNGYIVTFNFHGSSACVWGKD